MGAIKSITMTVSVTNPTNFILFFPFINYSIIFKTDINIVMLSCKCEIGDCVYIVIEMVFPIKRAKGTNTINIRQDQINIETFILQGWIKLTTRDNCAFWEIRGYFVIRFHKKKIVVILGTIHHIITFELSLFRGEQHPALDTAIAFV